MSADSAAAFTEVFFSLEDVISAGTRTFRSVLSNGAELTRAMCCIDAAARILISLEPSCKACTQKNEIICLTARNNREGHAALTMCFTKNIERLTINKGEWVAFNVLHDSEKKQPEFTQRLWLT